MFKLAFDESDEDLYAEANKDLDNLVERLDKLEFRRMFSGQIDEANAYLDIQAGSGGTEAQDWAEMLLRMYLRWAESKGFNTELVEISGGDVAGIKSATILVRGDFAFGWLRTETGVHRLVRKSPFDSGNRRHTSFASVFTERVSSSSLSQLRWQEQRGSPRKRGRRSPTLSYPSAGRSERHCW